MSGVILTALHIDVQWEKETLHVVGGSNMDTPTDDAVTIKVLLATVGSSTNQTPMRAVSIHPLPH